MTECPGQRRLRSLTRGNRELWEEQVPTPRRRDVKHKQSTAQEGKGSLWVFIRSTGSSGRQSPVAVPTLGQASLRHRATPRRLRRTRGVDAAVYERLWSGAGASLGCVTAPPR